ncbi:hypothetical protein SADUNF_Sadunf09G0067600 [Salix dunnii]|uniref:Formin-like protein 18 n=1 Tax=Salix dunnii TaxID=1413687 RepID=A0A835MR20_9ROSI|nr:hypothetical protein SADUNF_Sadunf09G0067600 [Salix dunnii]
MDPCPFQRILVGNLALRFPVSSKPSLLSLQCFCKIRLKNFPTQKATIPLVTKQNRNQNPEINSLSNSLAACYSLDKAKIDKFLSCKKPNSLEIEVYSRDDGATCGLRDGKLLGKVTVPLDLRKAESRPCVMHNGWIDFGENKKGESTQFYLCVRVEPDPRYVFQFGGGPECSPQVFQVQGSVRQAVFTCKFSLRNPGDRNLVSMPSMTEPTPSRNWLPSLGADKHPPAKERKGWSITIHDLSGSPVAMASMVTPFVPTPGSDHVSQSNPGAWLILRPSHGTWKPWGRLEAWREPNASALGYRFELLHDSVSASPATTTLVNSVINAKNGGKFTIDMTNSVSTPASSPHSSCDFGSGSGSWSGSEFSLGMLSPFVHKGFVMQSSVNNGNGPGSKPEVEIGVQHVNCTEDAATFVALAAAVDLSVDACKSFTHKLRKELRQSQSFVV